MDIILNEVYYSINKKRRIRIVKRNNKNTFLSKRVFKYTTMFGDNSAGDDREYNDFDTAVKNEMIWMEH